MSQKLDEMIISEKLSRIEPSITLAITALANQMKKEGKKVVSFSAGEPDFDTPDHIKRRAIRAIEEGQTRYTAAAGMIELRQAIVDKIQQDYQLSYSTDQIVVSCGAKHSIFNILFALLNPGDEVIIPTPYWVSYPAQVTLAGGETVYAPTDESTGFKLTPHQLKSVITSRSKVLILTSPSNPTGAIYSKEELEALKQVILDHQLLVISDEIYEKLIYGGHKYTSITQLGEEVRSRTILVNGVSKSYAMTGWRVGYFAADVAIAKAVNKIQSHTTSNPATPSQWASLEALTAGDQAVEEMKIAFDERRRYMVERLNAIPGFSCIEPFGAFYAFPNMAGCVGKRWRDVEIRDSLTFCEALLKSQCVACVPGSGFGAPTNLRLSYATSMDTIKDGLDRMVQFVRELS